MNEQSLKAIIIHHLSKVLEYNAFERFEGVTNKESFLEMIGNDPAFAPFFFNNPKYITARIGGNLITSLHRKLGDMYEELFKLLLFEELNIPLEDLSFSLSLNINGESQRRSADGLIKYSILSHSHKDSLNELKKINNAVGMAFEVRSCYQIGDSKRIQADRDMALALRSQNYEPVMIIFCSSSLIRER